MSDEMGDEVIRGPGPLWNIYLPGITNETVYKSNAPKRISQLIERLREELELDAGRETTEILSLALTDALIEGLKVAVTEITAQLVEAGVDATLRFEISDSYDE
jgi:hypothetical protein